ncbi:MAG: hypothetical protein RI974_577, partial [Actinomycetota bacterium]
AKSADVVELDRQLRLSEAVMRTKVLRADEAVVAIKPVVVPEVSAADLQRLLQRSLPPRRLSSHDGWRAKRNDRRQPCR